ncbi:hypothetical protein V9L05_00170 [Bernardetia sp. Wsw4-3y2]|uniref:hypothetical protein n=1 Tax=Bernardetia sp. Wsw4-3y2 TaxID=3127471 RepID=UPI0030D29163
MGHFFNTYANAINKKYKRTGSLFEEAFERKKVTSDSYLTTLIDYIHKTQSNTDLQTILQIILILRITVIYQKKIQN